MYIDPVYLLKYMTLLKLIVYKYWYFYFWNIKLINYMYFVILKTIRPIFNLKDNNGKKYNKLIQDTNYIKSWNNAIYGYMFEIN